jgi:flagellar biosynthesis protein FlhB
MIKIDTDAPAPFGKQKDHGLAMSDDKSEKPTARRLSKAREDGQVAKSADLNSAAVLGATYGLFLMGGTYGVSLLMSIMRRLLSEPHTVALGKDGVMDLLMSAGAEMGLILLPFWVGVMVAGIGVNLMQVKILFTLKPLEPNLTKLNPLTGVKRLFSLRSLIELLKAVLKMAVVGAIGCGVFNAHRNEVWSLSSQPTLAAVQQLSSWVFELMFQVFLAYLALGFADWRYQAFEHEKRLRMSKQDIKDESKTMEGNQQIKGQIKQAGHKILSRKQLANIPTADVIITNPTHFAIALRYDPDIAPAPHVVAKGVDHMAFKIREIAGEHKIECVENRPLARALYDQVDVGYMVPPELFVAVAEVLALVYRKKKGRRGKLKGPTNTHSI